jgi:plastocyanin
VRALLVAAAALLVAPALAQADTQFVTMQQSVFAPAQISAVVGDSVSWHNGSLRDHTVVTADGSFGSPGHVGPGGYYSAPFNTPGAFPYYCALHLGMTGEVDVYPLLLQGPPHALGAGEQIQFSGRAPAGTASVQIERDIGSGFVPVGTAAVDANGTFKATVAAAATSTYRAVDAAGASPPVQVVVVDRTVTLRAGRGGAARVSVTPADPGARVVLQVWLRERFGWFPVAQRKLDRHSRAEFPSRYAGRRARAVLVLPDGYTSSAMSAPVRLRQ